MTIDHSVTNTEQLEQQNPAIKTKLKLKKLASASRISN